MSWSDVVALEQIGTHRFRATAGDEWSSLQGVHGGYVASLAVAAAERVAGADRSEWLAWCRPRHGSTIDASWLTMFGDYFPPAVFTRVTGPNRAVTIEYSIQIHSAAGSWALAEDEELVARMHTFHSAEGFAVEDGWIWRADGELLATTRQTRLAG